MLYSHEFTGLNLQNIIFLTDLIDMQKVQTDIITETKRHAAYRVPEFVWKPGPFGYQEKNFLHSNNE